MHDTIANHSAAPTTMADRVASFDWSTTPIGPMEHWPMILRTAVDLCLSTGFPMRIWWGPELINIYNDSYAKLLGDRHPDALGGSAPKLWPEVWSTVAPQVTAVMERGESTWNERVHLVLERNGASEDVWLTWSYSPLREADGAINGILCVATEDTAQVLAERERQRLAKQERTIDERARTILESITDAFFALDRDYRFTYLNPQAYLVLNRRPGELLGKTIWEEYPGTVGSKFSDAYHKSMDEKLAGSVTTYYPDHDRWYEAHTYPAPDGISVYFRDVSERNRTEKAVKDIAEKYDAQSRLFERMASATPDFLYVFDRDCRVIYANRRLLEVWGVADAAGKTLMELGYQQWHADMHLREVKQVIATKKSFKGEVPFTGNSGISGIYEYIFTPVFGPNGEVEVVAGTTRDVTDRRQLEEQMARDGLLLANVRDSVIVTDLHGVVTFWNEGATRVFGWKPDEMIGRPMVERLPESERASATAWLNKMADGDADFSGEWHDFRKDGSRVWIEATTRKITDPAGRSLGIMGVSRDISDRKRAEAEREQLLASEQAARTESERNGRMKDEFLATLSHEIRTPLNAILGWSQIMKQSDDPADIAQGLDVIERNARAQSQIIEDLLDMSRIISGKVRLDVQRVDVSAIIQAAVESIRPTAETKGIRLHAVIDPLRDVVVSGDAGRLQQVMWNLLSNAMKFTPKQGRVQVLLERVESHLEISVIDTGEGIKPDFLPFVFDRFRQADASTTRRHGGLGLGLSIVKQLVELHGGSIHVKSGGVDCGTTFIVALPLTTVHPEPNPGRERRHPSAHAKPAAPKDVGYELSGVRVLVVDDEPDSRSLVKRILEDRHATVTDTGSAAEALRLIEQGSYDVLISDIGMPDEDGYSLIRRVRSLAKDKGGAIPAIALTAYARAEDRVKAVSAGFLMHVAKPVEPVELITMVAGAAGRTGPAKNDLWLP